MPKIYETRYAVKVGDRYVAGVGDHNVWLVDQWSEGRIFPSLEHARSWVRPWETEFPGLSPRIVKLEFSLNELDLETETGEGPNG